MKILADSHILIWFLSADESLSPKARSILEDENNTIYYSQVSLWEIAIKHKKRPDRLTLSAQQFAYFCKDQGFKEYPLNERHIFCLDTLHRKPGSDEHHDPFDQLLLAQAKSDGLVFMTHDSLIPDYEEPCILSV